MVRLVTPDIGASTMGGQTSTEPMRSPATGAGLAPIRYGSLTTKECTMIAALVLATLFAAATPEPHPGAPIEEEVHQNGLVGKFARPPDPGRHAAVIVLGGFGGGIPGEDFAFAERGYSTLALAYFGDPPLPKAIDQILVETISHAI